MKYYLIVLIRNALKIFFVFPIQKNRIIFNAYNGKQYGCNPKYIYEYLEDYSNKLDLIWAFESTEKFHFNTPVKKVRYKSLKYIYYVLTASIVVENSESWSIIPKRNGQTVINTWHGGGSYKKVGTSRKDGNSFNAKNVRDKNRRVDLYLSSSKAFSTQTLRESFDYLGEIMEMGMPRNDILVNGNESVVQQVKNKLNIANKKVVLIAPTFRNVTDFALESFNFDLLLDTLEAKMKGSWVILYRSHYYETTKVNDPRIIDVSNYPDMQELLLSSDVLITDFSSCMWDFSLSFKPVFLLSSDIEEYQEREREFYTDPYSWPYSLALTFDKLIQNISDFDDDEYQQKLVSHHKDLQSFESGKATSAIGEYILRKTIREDFHE
ncbi:CDP-glycerol glycerophosphotransferase family protein [Erysipelothrix sp. strain 2 (EsS2-6-Brazil)]|uniref:CDP-glycerol glycerophosphotransferase n=1 Tax=Erysipelothrix rhusiopathiae TaxID=1648 RepID=A0A4V0P1B6_ERYRH|nr:CDP-glycerol glycerophosphotransferase family protein [Erysipelothrix sp. strain 2 (EsS2-6-Brazil)]MBK2401984.1 hypothetical protein [Erysipelothrix sp. strain 2 (EsS2-6-Brazil)]BBE36429.1 CDP-glycerol glycerophosphotransferase [Erysipelothrix rhusiopathiae]BBE36440.1 CDP-glycerol glycerophosphotransferase [Erysipelothrix rhusiopathiae]